ncbi:PVC-type heme-binding CxxCH protein [Rhodopirellula europaea]|uniref:Membrane-bound dehydrogenase domain protein n=1 Tax=Rhodopirellula europaea 6C TaxID=1263867 RepID=M2AX99_9BACT|nr:PVC-type heme-binding CxxCH protein [Rhodopirellula europaea]EMB17337.1 membrane-bound dehydrogenase domain protein [Rhodopirellula europaea 6C]
MTSMFYVDHAKIARVGTQHDEARQTPKSRQTRERTWMSCLLAIVVLGSPAAADDFPTPINTEPLAELNADGKLAGPPLLSPQEAADSLEMPEGFTATVFASEPEVQNPIDLAWDRKGQLWVAENYTYGQRGVSWRDDQRDRVLVFKDENLDGVSESRTVFLDSVQHLTSVEVGRGGVWLMCPPQLLFVPDADGDAVPDGPPQVILDGFTIAKQNYHNLANGLRFGPDGWLYGRCGGSCPGVIGLPGTPEDERTAIEGGIWRYNVDTHHVEVLCHGTTNPWGHDFDRNGELFFINTVNGHLWHGIHGAHLHRPFTLDPNPNAYELIDQHADHYHFDTSGKWQDSRDGAANDYGGGHAHVGMMIYQESTWPTEYQDDLYTLNFHGRRANRERLEPHGTGYVGKHEKDFFLSGDVWFRGMEMSAGPDGNVVVLDWADLGECHEHSGVHRSSGRIFQIRYEAGTPDNAAERLAKLNQPGINVEQTVAFQLAGDRWFSHQSRLQIAEAVAGGADASELNAELLKQFKDVEGTNPQQRLRMLWTLNVSGGLSRKVLLEGVADPSPHVRSWCFRLMTQHWPIDDVFGPTSASVAAKEKVYDEYRAYSSDFLTHAEADVASVRLTLASILQRLPLGLRGELADFLTELRSGIEDADDHNQGLMIWYGLMACADEHPDELLFGGEQCQIPTTTRLISRALAERVDQHPKEFARLVTSVTRRLRGDSDLGGKANVACADAFLEGVSAGIVGVRKAERPEDWADFQTVLSAHEDLQTKHAETLRKLNTLFGEGQSVGEMAAVAGDGDADVLERLAAVRGLIETRGADDAVPDSIIVRLAMPLIKDPRVNAKLAPALSTIELPEVGSLLLDNLNRFRAPRRSGVVGLLCSRAVFADVLLTSIEQKKQPKDVLAASHVRTILSLEDKGLTERIENVWGRIRDTPDDRKREIEHWSQALTRDQLAKADASAGRGLFQSACANCHKLFGTGGKVGPDLTGAQRSDLGYLLHNIIDPDSVVGADYRATKIVTVDGRLLVGLVTQRTRQTTTIVAADQTWVLPNDDIELESVTEQSPMPSGLLQPMTEQQVVDLIGYLQSPTQVSLPSEKAAN